MTRYCRRQRKLSAAVDDGCLLVAESGGGRGGIRGDFLAAATFCCPTFFDGSHGRQRSNGAWRSTDASSCVLLISNDPLPGIKRAHSVDSQTESNGAHLLLQIVTTSRLPCFTDIFHYTCCQPLHDVSIQHLWLDRTLHCRLWSSTPVRQPRCPHPLVLRRVSPGNSFFLFATVHAKVSPGFYLSLSLTADFVANALLSSSRDGDSFAPTLAG